MPVLDNDAGRLSAYLTSTQIVSFSSILGIEQQIAYTCRRSVRGQHNISDHRLAPVASVAILIEDRTEAEEIVSVFWHREAERDMSLLAP